ncbi:hypothetical protein M8J75_012911 [Diaphorina citri]|nr:hypothetical protein M8J75_012911 [Diaphorina citri]
MNIVAYLTLFVTLFITLSAAAPAPFWWNSFNGPNPTPARQNERTGRSGKDRYKALCKVINPDPYAFPGRIPYPAAPFCP